MDIKYDQGYIISGKTTPGLFNNVFDDETYQTQGGQNNTNEPPHPCLDKSGYQAEKGNMKHVATFDIEEAGYRPWIDIFLGIAFGVDGIPLNGNDAVGNHLLITLEGYYLTRGDVFHERHPRTADNHDVTAFKHRLHTIALYNVYAVVVQEIDTAQYAERGNQDHDYYRFDNPVGHFTPNP
jgi:hypothetical protein